MKQIPLLVKIFCVLCLSLAAHAQPTSVAPAIPTAKLPPKAQLQIYLLMGQSNMAGRGNVDEVPQLNDPHILVFNKEDKWAVAKDPLHWDKAQAGVGPGSGFALEMRKHDPAITIGLVPCAVGGTPLSKWEKGAPLFNAAIARAKLAMQTGTLAGVLWHQGEADGNPENAPTYAKRLEQMLRDLRKALNAPNLPIVLGETGRFKGGEFATRGGKSSSWLKMVNAGTLAAAHTVPNVGMANSKGLKDRGDKLHFSATSARELGHRYATEMLTLQKNNPHP